MSLAGYDAWKTNIDEEVRRHEAGTTEAAEDAALLRFVHGPSARRWWIVARRYGYQWDVVRAGSELAEGWQVVGSIKVGRGRRWLTPAMRAKAVLWAIVHREVPQLLSDRVRA